MTEVEKAQATIKIFDDKRRAAIEKNIELADERQSLPSLRILETRKLAQDWMHQR
jgi:hypothetical protein